MLSNEHSTLAPMHLQIFTVGHRIAGSGKQAELVDASKGKLVATRQRLGSD